MILTLLTDYGFQDDFVGACHGVIRSIAPEAQVIDVTHGIPRGDVRHGALVMRNTLPYMPAGVHVAVVDPEVGTARRAVALRCGDGRLLVGPDNGLLSLAWEAAGGVEEAVEISLSPYRLESPSATFHGRDVFAPVAAHLALGAVPADGGEPLDPATLARIELPRPRRERDGTVVAHALIADGFGNVALDVTAKDLADAGLLPGGEVELQLAAKRFAATYATTFADARPGEPLLYEDGYRMIAVALNRGDARATLGIEPDAELRLRRTEPHPGGVRTIENRTP